MITNVKKDNTSFVARIKVFAQNVVNQRIGAVLDPSSLAYELQKTITVNRIQVQTSQVIVSKFKQVNISVRKNICVTINTVKVVQESIKVLKKAIVAGNRWFIISTEQDFLALRDNSIVKDSNSFSIKGERSSRILYLRLSRI